MRITARQLRQIIKEELIREMDTGMGTMAFDEELPGAKAPDSTPEQRAWIEAVTKRPLRLGSEGENVVMAQKLLVDQLRVIGSRGVTLIDSRIKQLRTLLRQPGSTDVRSLVNMLADKIEASGPDGNFGPMTKLATEIFQDKVQMSVRSGATLEVDGKIGRETGIMLINGLTSGPLGSVRDYANESHRRTLGRLV